VVLDLLSEMAKEFGFSSSSVGLEGTERQQHAEPCISISLVARASNAPDLGNPQSDLSAWNDFCRENDA
jgi:hypothetical protein